MSDATTRRMIEAYFSDAQVVAPPVRVAYQGVL